MRVQPFLTTILQAYQDNPRYIDLDKASYFASTVQLRGGWEVWLQLEIASVFMQASQGSQTCDREYPYPAQGGGYLAYNAANGAVTVVPNANAASRCDFFLHRTAGMADDTYLELKCILAAGPDPLNNAWNRFHADVAKQQALQNANGGLNCISLLATFGTFTDPQVKGPSPSLGYFWSGGRTAYVIDLANLAVTTLANVATGGAARFFLVGVSV
ncbi:hypothetical protein [Aurantimonas sp. VKM B-3413]|uniref:hypothetical protein n=1 Tax=Aurantimonas sp. VKM B-3413 TaxID=2779401 RepID=UPI001E466059|nr:hypothetical protein [Aurantimonas sp. VKM B-3413]MCB8836507.1 hypothetical protein [Aurantimonas sp. VKM B-3413]